MITRAPGDHGAGNGKPPWTPAGLGWPPSSWGGGGLFPSACFGRKVGNFLSLSSKEVGGGIRVDSTKKKYMSNGAMEQSTRAQIWNSHQTRMFGNLEIEGFFIDCAVFLFFFIKGPLSGGGVE